MASDGEYYGFKADESAEVINWAKVAAGLGDQLTAEAKRREDKKADIDKSSQDLGTFIADSPLGGHEGAVASTTDLANQAQEMRLMQDRMLKSGELSLRDYNTMRGNLTKDVETLYSSASEFQKLYTDDIARTQSGQAALEETWRNSNLEGFLNPSKTKYRFDPKTGQLMVGSLGEDGNLVQSSLRPVSAIQQEVRTKTDALDVNTEVANITKQLPGKFKQAIMSGNVKSIKGVVDMPSFQEALDDQVNSLLVDPSQAASVLTNFLGEYTIEDFTTDPNEKGEDKILMIPNPQNPGSGAMIPDLTEKQMSKAKDAIKNAFLLNIGYEEEARKDPREIKPTATDIALADRNKQREVYIGYTTDLVSGTPQEFDTAANILISQFNRGKKKGEDKISNIKRLSNGIEITYENQSTGEMRTVPVNSEGKEMEALVIEVANLTTPIDLGTSISEYSFDDVMFNPEASQVSKGVVESDDLADMYITVSGTAKPVVEMFEGLSGGKDFAALARRILAEKVRGKIVNVDNKGTWAGNNRKIVIDIDGVKTEIPYDSESYINNMTNMQAFLDKLEGVEVKPAAEGKKKLPGT